MRTTVVKKSIPASGKTKASKAAIFPLLNSFGMIRAAMSPPMPQKAIRSEVIEEVDFAGNRIELQRPYVLEDLCNGCGICYFVCPEPGGIRVSRRALASTRELAGVV